MLFGWDLMVERGIAPPLWETLGSVYISLSLPGDRRAGFTNASFLFLFLLLLLLFLLSASLARVSLSLLTLIRVRMAFCCCRSSGAIGNYPKGKVALPQ